MRYFFRVSSGGKTYEVEEGIVLPDAESARLEARRLTSELLRGGDRSHGLNVCVVDEQGNETVRIDVAIETSRRQPEVTLACAEGPMRMPSCPTPRTIDQRQAA